MPTEKRVMSKKISVIKQIKAEHNLPNDKILDIVARNGGSLADSTLRRISIPDVPAHIELDFTKHSSTFP